MSRTRQRRGHPAARVALGIVVAGLMAAGLPAQADSADTYASRAEYMASQKAAPAYPNPQYPNHKPLRGNYPGSYTTASPPAERPSGSFDWRAAGIGAAGTLGLMLVLVAATGATRIGRRRRHAIPFVVDVRDNTRSTG
jgi:hypothetical protein